MGVMGVGTTTSEVSQGDLEYTHDMVEWEGANVRSRSFYEPSKGSSGTRMQDARGQRQVSSPQKGFTQVIDRVDAETVPGPEQRGFEPRNSSRHIIEQCEGESSGPFQPTPLHNSLEQRGNYWGVVFGESCGESSLRAPNEGISAQPALQKVKIQQIESVPTCDQSEIDATCSEHSSHSKRSSVEAEDEDWCDRCSAGKPNERMTARVESKQLIIDHNKAGTAEASHPGISGGPATTGTFQAGQTMAKSACTEQSDENKKMSWYEQLFLDEVRDLPTKRRRKQTNIGPGMVHIDEVEHSE